MHEYSIVESLVSQLTAQVAGVDSRRVSAIRVRLGSTLAEASIRQAFEMLTRRTPLEGAALSIESFKVCHTCPKCQAVHTVHHDDLLGHVFICPQCGLAAEVDEAHGISVSEVILD